MDHIKYLLMRRFLIIICLLSGHFVLAQKDKTAQKYAGLITSEALYDKLSILASDVLEGRETGERGQKMAAAFIGHHFESIGLKPPVRNGLKNTFFQDVPLYTSVSSDTYIKIYDKKKRNLQDIIYMSDQFPNIETSLDVVFAGFASEEVFDQVEVKGKAVVFIAKERSSKRAVMARIENKGAKLMLIVNTASQEAFDEMKTKHQQHYQKGKLGLEKPEQMEQKNKAGVFHISPEIAGELFNTTFANLKDRAEHMAAGKNVKRKMNPAVFAYMAQNKIKTVLSENVLGYIEGTDKKEELLVITAHYDHIGKSGELINNGADDDASGTSSIMQIAEAFVQAKKDGNGSRRSILFMAVTGEEKGLLGSAYYTDNPIFPLENTVANLNIDMIGRVDSKHAKNSDYVYLVGSDKLSTELHQISEQTNATYTNFELDYTYNDESHPSRIYYRSDHWNFAKNNVPIIFYFNGTHGDYHKPTDTIDKIDFDLMTKRAKLVFHTAWILANRENRIVVDKTK